MGKKRFIPVKLTREKIDALLNEVKAIYAELEARTDEERCCEKRSDCCQFEKTGSTPYLTFGEAFLITLFWKESGRPSLPVKKDGSCPFFESASGRCLVYEARPFACRTHFCKAAGGNYARRDVIDLIRRLESVDRSFASQDGPLPLVSAVTRAMRGVHF